MDGVPPMVVQAPAHLLTGPLPDLFLVVGAEHGRHLIVRAGLWGGTDDPEATAYRASSETVRRLGERLVDNRCQACLRPARRGDVLKYRKGLVPAIFLAL